MATAGNIEFPETRALRREARRRQVRRRRLAAAGVLAALSAAALFGLVQLLTGAGASAAVSLKPVRSMAVSSPFRTPLPEEIRGVHITGPLMTLTGKLDSYLALRRNGLNTIELDVKDETGNVAFVKGAPALALHDGAARPYYDPAEVVHKVHKAGV
ncbi:MAG: putative glycoside hydrolase, partial [Gaiellaceae bacterium]